MTTKIFKLLSFLLFTCFILPSLFAVDSADLDTVYSHWTNQFDFVLKESYLDTLYLQDLDDVCNRGNTTTTDMIIGGDLTVDSTNYDLFIDESTGNVFFGGNTLKHADDVFEVQKDRNQGVGAKIQNDDTAGDETTAYWVSTIAHTVDTGRSCSMGMFGENYDGGATYGNALGHFAGEGGIMTIESQMNIIAMEASSGIDFYTGGPLSTNKRMEIDSTGNVTFTHDVRIDSDTYGFVVGESQDAGMYWDDTENDIKFTDDINIHDTHPHLRFTPTSGDRWEFFCNINNRFQFINDTTKEPIWGVEDDDNLDIYRRTDFSVFPYGPSSVTPTDDDHLVNKKYVDDNAGISGPGSSTDNAIPRWDGEGGDTLQDSGITISDSDYLTIPLTGRLYVGYGHAMYGSSSTLYVVAQGHYMHYCASGSAHKMYVGGTVVQTIGGWGSHNYQYFSSALGFNTIVRTAPDSIANRAWLYAKDVSASAEMFVMDEGGTETQISAHDEEGYHIHRSSIPKRKLDIQIDIEKFFRDKFPEYISEVERN